MRDALIVGAVRSAVGRKNGKLAGVRPDDLAAHVLRELDALAAQSHEKAGRAIAEGRFRREITPVTLPDGALFDTDEGVRVPVNREKMAQLVPSFKPDGVVTAANSSQISDGAAALMLVSPEKAKALGL